jgi:Activator of mitotic machinery Cdc14 phosphatase activation C-term
MDSISASSHDEPNSERPTRKRSRNASAGTGSDGRRIGMVPPGGISLQDAPVILIEDEPIQEEPTSIIISPPPPAETPQNNTNRVAGPRTSSLPNATLRDMLAEKLKADSQPVVDTTTTNIPSNIPIVADTPSTNELTLPKAPSPSPSTSTGRKSTWSRLFLRAADDSNKTKRNKADTKPEVVEERPQPLPAPEVLSPSPPSTRSTSPALSESLASASGRKFGSLSSLFSRASVRPAGSKTDTNSSKVASAHKVASKKVPPLPKRLPIHVERAIYRLSHQKLANPRRPLQHQVIISNFMFWYLSIVDASNAHHNNSGEVATAAAASPEQEGHDKKGKKVNKFVAAGKKRRQEIIQNKQRKVALAHERMGGRRSETVIPTVQYDKQVSMHHPLPHVGPRGPLMTPQQYIGTASAASTGFVVPQQYLHPATKPSSEGESDGEDDEEEDDENVQWPLPPKVSSQPSLLDLHPGHLGAFGSELIDMIKLDDEEDDVPLALYRKSH